MKFRKGPIEQIGNIKNMVLARREMVEKDMWSQMEYSGMEARISQRHYEDFEAVAKHKVALEHYD